MLYAVLAAERGYQYLVPQDLGQARTPRPSARTAPSMHTRSIRRAGPYVSERAIVRARTRPSPLAHEAAPLSDALRGNVVRTARQLDPRQRQLNERPPTEQSHGTRGVSAPPCGRLVAVDVVQGAAALQRGMVRVHDGELQPYAYVENIQDVLGHNSPSSRRRSTSSGANRTRTGVPCLQRSPEPDPNAAPVLAIALERSG